MKVSSILRRKGTLLAGPPAICRPDDRKFEVGVLRDSARVRR